MENILTQAALDIKAGRVVVFPTETFYGLAVDPFNDDAVESLLRLKDRELTAGIPLIAASIEIVETLVGEEASYWKSKRRALQENFWPGPLTIVIEPNETIKERIAKGVFGPQQSLAVRVSGKELARELAGSSAGLITSTSANPKGLPPAETAQQARHYFPSLNVVEDFPTSERVVSPSTIVDTRRYPFTILREGAVPREKLRPYLP